MKRYLTKSRFKLAVECPTKLFYTGKDLEYRNLKKEDSFLEALADGGFQVGKMATLLFPGGYEITSKNHDEAVSETDSKLNTQDNIILFEAAVRFENLFIRIDVLVKNADHFELMEVKAKSYNSVDPDIEGARVFIKSEMLPYIQDVAFQKYVLSKAYPGKSISSFLMMPDKAVASTINGLNQLFKIQKGPRSTDVFIDPSAAELVEQDRRILAKVNVDVYVDYVLQHVIEFPGGSDYLPAIVHRWSEEYRFDRKIPPVIHKGCAHCEYRNAGDLSLKSGYHECLQQVTQMTEAEIDAGTVLDIWNYRGKDKLLSHGIYKLSQVTESDLKIVSNSEGLSNGERQWLQCSGIPKEQDKGGFYLDVDRMQEHMGSWRYPLHMIDFETSTTALPFFRGMRPYASVAFQYSHHIIEANGSVRHAGEFLLAEPGVFPNFDFVRALRKELSKDDGTIFRWATHENTILNHIADQLRNHENPPVDREELLGFITSVTKGGDRAMVDLNDLARRAYFHPETKGRTSIKKVLPAILSTSEYLREKYSKPIYGSQIPSLNFSNFSWWQESSGQLVDPYQRLKGLVVEMLGAEGEDIFDAEELEIAEGGAAAMAFARLQFEDLSTESRDRIKAALLRYCELDTLAMVMIVEAWREWSH